MVTFNTNRNNIEPMFWGITLVMVVVVCLFATRAFQFGKRFKFAINNSLSNRSACFYSIRMIGFILACMFKLIHLALFALVEPFRASLAFFTLLITFLNSFAFFGASILLSCVVMARFTMCITTIFASFIYIVIRQWKILLTICAGLCYNLLRHGSFSFLKRLCLGPVADYTSVAGSFYNNHQMRRCQIFL